MHGKQSSINLIENHDEIYFGIRNKLKVGRYHSWAVESIKNSNLLVTSVDELGTVMSFKHKIYDIHGVQYHPESILTNYGEKILKTGLNLSSHKNFSFWITSSLVILMILLL